MEKSTKRSLKLFIGNTAQAVILAALSYAVVFLMMGVYDLGTAQSEKFSDEYTEAVAECNDSAACVESIDKRTTDWFIWFVPLVGAGLGLIVANVWFILKLFDDLNHWMLR